MQEHSNVQSKNSCYTKEKEIFNPVKNMLFYLEFIVALL